MKRVYFFITIFMFSVIAFSVRASDWLTASEGGRQFKLPIPEDFCETGSSEIGQFLMEYLTTVASNNEMMGSPKVIYKDCRLGADEIYPWGYVTIYPRSGLINSQKDLNKLRAKLYGDDKIFGPLARESADKNELISTEFDVDIKITDIGTPQTIWEDDNSIISFIVNEVMIDGVLTIEKLIGSGTAIKAHVVEYVIIDDKVDGGIDTKVAAFGLAKNAKTLKELNP